MQHAEKECMMKGTSLFRLALAQLVLATLVLGFATQGVCAEKFWIDTPGYVVYKNDRGDVVKKEFTKYRDVKFAEKPKKVGYFHCRHDSIDVQIHVDDLKTIKIDPMIDYGALVTTEAKEFAVYVPMDLANSLTNMNHLEISFQNKINLREEVGFILGTDILEIHFQEKHREGVYVDDCCPGTAN